jgi:hypothetical protein
MFFFNRGRNRRRRRGGRKYRKVKLRFKANAAGEGQTNTYNTGSHDNTVTMPSATTSAANGGSHGNISYLTPANSSTSSRNTTASLSSATHNTFQQDNNVLVITFPTVFILLHFNKRQILLFSPFENLKQ